MNVQVVICGENIGEMALHFIDKYKMIALKLSSKWTLRRLCRCLHANPIVQLSDITKEDFGYIESLYTQEIGGDVITVFSQGNKNIGESEVSSIIIRGATDTILQDVERAIDDGVNMVKAMCKNGKFVAGAGAVEIEIARRLSKFANTQSGLEQYAIAKYAEALEVVPRTIAENSGLNESEIISALYKAHEEGDKLINQEQEQSKCYKIGVDIQENHVKDMTTEGVLDLMATRQMGIKLSSQAALTILKVDHIIMKKPAGGPRPQKRGHWDDDDQSW